MSLNYLVNLLLLFFIASAVYVYYANAEALRDVQIDCTSVIDVHPDVIEKSLLKVQIDAELGEPYRVYPIETSPDSDRVFRSTLIEYPFGSSPRADSQNNVSLRGIILYVHGYNDYFFQKELAEKADFIRSELHLEEEQFQKALENGTREFNKLSEKFPPNIEHKVISGRNSGVRPPLRAAV